MKFFFVIFGFFMLAHAHLSVADQQQSSLVVNIGNINHEGGHFIISIYKDESSFLKKADMVFIYDFSELDKTHAGDTSLTIKQLPFGSFALGVVHDVNGNKEMDTKIFGIPAEPVGFSNNPRNKFGPPKFKQSVFTFSEDQQQLQINLLEI